MLPESKPVFVRTLVGSVAAVAVVVGSAVDVASMVGSGLDVVMKDVEVAESEGISVEPETVSTSISVVDFAVVAVSVSFSETAVESVKKVVDVSVSSTVAEEETTVIDVDSTVVVGKATAANKEVGWHDRLIIELPVLLKLYLIIKRSFHN
jgi:hypothetical protein